jgi:hypothetical protein
MRRGLVWAAERAQRLRCIPERGLALRQRDRVGLPLAYVGARQPERVSPAKQTLRVALLCKKGERGGRR